jgi:hypothetical protein
MAASDPIAPAAVREALADHETIGPVGVASDPATTADWATLAELVLAPGRWMARVAERTGGDPGATAALLVTDAARAVTGLPVAMLAASGRALVARPEHVRLRLESGGRVTGIAILGGGVVVDPGDRLAELHGATLDRDGRTRIWYAGGTLAALAAPIIDAVASLGELRRRVLWALVADEAAATAMAAEPDAIAAAALIEEVWGTLPARPPSRVILERVADTPTALRARRVGCCHAFRRTAGARCAECPDVTAPGERAPATLAP